MVTHHVLRTLNSYTCMTRGHYIYMYIVLYSQLISSLEPQRTTLVTPTMDEPTCPRRSKPIRLPALPLPSQQSASSCCHSGQQIQKSGSRKSKHNSLAEVSRPQTRFDYVVSSLNPKFAMEICDLLLKPPDSRP